MSQRMCCVHPVYVCLCNYICIYMYMRIYVYICIRIYLYVYVYTYIRIYIHTHTYIYVYIYVYIYICIYICIHIHMYTYTYTYIYLYSWWVRFIVLFTMSLSPCRCAQHLCPLSLFLSFSVLLSLFSWMKSTFEKRKVGFVTDACWDWWVRTYVHK